MLLIPLNRMSYIVRATPHTSEQLKLLQSFLDTSNIPHSFIPASPSILPSMTTNPIHHIERPPTRFKLTPEFKLFLGNEYMNKNGITSFEDILERIYKYVNFNKLLSNDNYGFYLDDTLQRLLKTYSKKIDWDNLHQHILLLLVKIT